MVDGKSLLEYTNLFSPINYEKNAKIILIRWENYNVLFTESIEELNS